MAELTADNLKETARCTEDSASGLDQWAPRDKRLLSDKAFDSLAEIINMIEGGAEWSEQLETARAAFLAKDLDQRLNPLEYRVFLMLPAIYRMWSKTRLRHLQPLVAAWAEP